MTIACLGWGSLIWDPRDLPLAGDWNPDGPTLPLEFARRSREDHLTLVIVSGAADSQTLWAPLETDDLGDAVNALASRERTKPHRIGRWAPEGSYKGQEAISAWAASKGLSGVVWTALPANFRNREDVLPDQEDLVGYLRGLTGDSRALAAAYIRNAPEQIRTRYRLALAKALED